MEFFKIFADTNEKLMFNEYRQSVFSIIPATILHLWIDFACKIYLQVDKSANLKLLIDRRVAVKIQPFLVERVFTSTLLYSQQISDSILQNIASL